MAWRGEESQFGCCLPNQPLQTSAHKRQAEEALVSSLIVGKIEICGGKLYGNVYQAYQPRDELSHDVMHNRTWLYIPERLRSASRVLDLYICDSKDVVVSCTGGAISHTN